MENLDKKYLDRLHEIKKSIQESPNLEAYLENEEEGDYKALQEAYEPAIQDLYLEVADLFPLQLVGVEKELMDPGYEGLYLPKVIGYSVLRGEVNNHFKYRLPQDHFKEVLLAIANSANFELIKQRIGQSIQIGFALSSDIWITNLIEQVENKRVKYFLQSQKIERYRDERERDAGLQKYRRQFESLNYASTEFPSTASELKLMKPSLQSFLLYRANHAYDNSSLHRHISAFINNDELRSQDEYLQIMMIIGMYYELSDAERSKFTSAINDMRKEQPDFSENYLTLLDEFHKSDLISVSDEADKRIAVLISRDASDEVSKIYDLFDTIHGKGWINESTIDEVRKYYDQHEGQSTANEIVREVIMGYSLRFLSNLEPTAYQDFFEINKTLTQYIGIFSNQKFNQFIKELSLKYVKKLLKVFTDKRGRDYQDIKKFVVTTFIDLGFMKDKELVELFKTRRKKKVE